jgi:hypothetical protein
MGNRAYLGNTWCCIFCETYYKYVVKGVKYARTNVNSNDGVTEEWQEYMGKEDGLSDRQP